MTSDGVHPDVGLDRLCRLIRATMAIEHAGLGLLSEMLDDGDNFPPAEAKELVDYIHRHRVGMIKQRALAGALGLDI